MKFTTLPTSIKGFCMPNTRYIMGWGMVSAGSDTLSLRLTERVPRRELPLLFLPPITTFPCPNPPSGIPDVSGASSLSQEQKTIALAAKVKTNKDSFLYMAILF